MSLDIFPEDSACYNNTKAAIDKIDKIVDESGIGFTNARYQSGVITILSEASSYLSERDNVQFLHEELDEIRLAIANTQ